MAAAAEQKEMEGAERFDASQYAFFGGEAQEVELGGLDEDEDDALDHLNGLEDEDVLSSSPVDADEIDLPSEAVDVADLANSFTKLSTERQAGNGLSEPEGGVRDFPVDRELLEQYAWAETLRSFQQRRWARELPNHLPSSPSWPGQPSAPQINQLRQQFASLQAGPGPGPGPLLQHGNVGLPQFASAVQQAGPWLRTNIGPALLQRHLPPQSNVLSLQVLQHQRPQVSVRPYGQDHQQQQAYGVLQGPKMSRDDSDNRHGPYPSRKEEFRSKYMTAEEIETILRIQWTATHSSDPYVEDYYHQAVQAKQAGATPHGRRHFAPSHLRDLPSHARSTAEPHAYLQVEALGRIPYSSIRRPRPLLEVEDVGNNASAAAAATATGEDKPATDAAKQRRLEQEPMLVARIAVEDGLCLLLDVDDIDRMLSVSQQAEEGMHLRHRRQILLDELAASLQLVDPLAPGNGSVGHFGLAATKDDLVFLRLVSLPKGRKLVARYLRLLVPGSELVRIVAMAVLRHLRFLFGGAQSDPESSSLLARAVASAIMDMDLASLSACLAAVVLAQEPPPLRPLGSPTGDGATIVLQAVLDRATMILSDRNISMQQQQYRVENTTVWQASFDAFFSLLSNYCSRKYESIMHSLRMSSSVSSAAAAAMGRAMPIELLKASLPHTNEQQRQRLLEFAQRSMVAPEQQHSSNTPAPPPAAAARG